MHLQKFDELESFFSSSFDEVFAFNKNAASSSVQSLFQRQELLSEYFIFGVNQVSKQLSRNQVEGIVIFKLHT